MREPRWNDLARSAGEAINSGIVRTDPLCK